MRSGDKDVPEINDWILANMTQGQKLGIDAWLVTAGSAKAMKSKLGAKNIELVSVVENPVDQIWSKQGRPQYPCGAVETLDVSRAGVSHLDKIAALRKELVATETVAFVVTMLDEIAWLLNIRGADVEFNPVVISYVIVTLNDVFWFVDSKKVTEEARRHLGEGVTIREYAEVEITLAEIVKTGKVLIDSSKTNYRLYQVVDESMVDKASPVTLPKSLKNDTELNGIRACHIRDGVALTAFLQWLQTTVRAAPGTFSEYRYGTTDVTRYVVLECCDV